MSKIEYASIYAILATVVVGFMLYMGRNTDEKQRYVKRQLYVIFIMLVLYFTSFFTNDVIYLSVNNCMVQIMQVVTAYMFLLFVIKFTDSGIVTLKVPRILVDIFAALDIIMLFINAINNMFFEYEIKTFDGGIYVQPKVNLIYMLHICLVAIMIILMIGILCKKVVKVSAAFRMGYLIIIVAFTIGLAFCELIRSLGYYTNFASVLTMTFGECIIFDVFYRYPRRRLEKMKDFAVENFSLPVFIFDEKDILEFVNEPASKLMPVEIGMPLDEFIADNNLKYIITPERRKSGKTKEFTLTLEYKDTNYFLHGQELWDNKDNFVGTFLVYSDISKQEKLKDEATYHATRDALTGLWNREYFLEMTESILSENPDMEYVMIVSDVAKFKMFNDILGKQMGDDLILTISEGIKLRQGAGWLASRVAGDRFAILMPKDEFNSESFVKTSMAVINERKYGLSVHLYLGVYEIKDNTLSAADIYDRAFMALESIKGQADKHIAYYEEAIR